MACSDLLESYELKETLAKTRIGEMREKRGEKKGDKKDGKRARSFC